MIDRLQRAGRERLATFPRLLLVSVAFFVVSLLQPPTLYAQSAQETALARSLFEEGLQAADAQEWERAADRFERAYSLKPTPGIAYNWACALAELGKVVEAGERLRVIRNDPATPEELREQSEAKLSMIAPRVAAVVVHVDGRSNDLTVLLDRQALPRAAWGAGWPTDPGSHTLSLMRADEALASESIELSAGERREVTLREPAPVVAVVPNPVKVNPEGSVHDERKAWFQKRWVLWTAVGVVVVAGAVTTTLLLSGDDKKEPAPVGGDTTPPVIRW